MRVQTNPDKHIRKAISDKIKANIAGTPVYDSRIPAGVNSEKYIIMSTQTKTVDDQFNKCDDRWDCTILLDLVYRVTGTGNTASRVPLNDMEEGVISAVRDLPMTRYKVQRLVLESSDSLDNITDTQNVFRQLMRYRLWLIEA